MLESFIYLLFYLIFSIPVVYFFAVWRSCLILFSTLFLGLWYNICCVAFLFYFLRFCSFTRSTISVVSHSRFAFSIHWYTERSNQSNWLILSQFVPGRVVQSVGHLTRKSEVLGTMPGMATYFRFSFRCFKRGSCQLLAKVCARSTG